MHLLQKKCRFVKTDIPSFAKNTEQAKKSFGK